MKVFNRMLERYGKQYWWPGETWFEVMVGAILTQATSWTNVEKAIANIKAAGVLTPTGIRDIGEDELAELIYSSGYYNAKARKLKALAEYVGTRFNDDLAATSRFEMAELREELLDVHGIGEETADDILLYAVGRPAFVIDSYTRRIFSRLGYSPVSSNMPAARISRDELPRSRANRPGADTHARRAGS